MKSAPGKKGPVKRLSTGRILLLILKNLGKFIATACMVCIITGCIVSVVLTVYILKYIESDESVNLEDIELSQTTILYATDSSTGEVYELKRLYKGGENRIWINYDDIPIYAREAVVAVEDQRFYTHQGVDWKRTAGAFVNLFVPIYSSQQGGSTITQQLIKNATGQDEVRIERKVQEIFRAIDLEKRYSKEQILESYLNIVPFGNGTLGLQSAANLYFGKDARDLTLAECAAIVGITQYPGAYDPLVYPEANKGRQEHILKEMLKQGKITQTEHDAAVAQQLVFKGEEHFATIQATQSYFEDHVIESVIKDLMAQYGYTKQYATEKLYGGGYRIYTTVDETIQKKLEDIYSSTENFPAVLNEEYPQSACVITDHNGKIVAMEGGIGEKDQARVFNRATMAKRHPGSSLKPIAAYALALEYDYITYSTVIEDSPLTLTEPGKGSYSWPTNYYSGYAGYMTIDTAIQRSTNTVAAKMVDALTPRRVFDFLQNQLDFYSLVESVQINGQVLSDVNLSSMALGGMTYGVTPLEMVGGYQIIANGGYFTAPYAYTRVVDSSSNNVVLENNATPRRVISSETSTILNKLLQRVVYGPNGTGRSANLGAMPAAGKTGTSTDDVDQWFIGMTPYYICQVWLGYDEPAQIRYYSYGPPILWKTIMTSVHEDLEPIPFTEYGEVVSMPYCVASGDLATSNCPATATGWYKKSKLPGQCTQHTSVKITENTDDNSKEGSSSATPSSQSSSKNSKPGNSGGNGTAIR